LDLLWTEKDYLSVWFVWTLYLNVWKKNNFSAGTQILTPIFMTHMTRII
jgi:hypothetical protein